jgi:5-methylcytosine-specific restriction enzyme B
MKKLATADKVREYVLVTFILPARRRGERTISFSSSDIHNGMGLKGRFPLVCSSIDADKFLEYANVVLASREGPKQSSTVRWVFDING